MSKQQAKPAAGGGDSARIFAEVAERSSRIMADFLKRQRKRRTRPSPTSSSPRLSWTSRR